MKKNASQNQEKITTSFNSLAEQLQAPFASNQASEKRYQSLFEASHVSLWEEDGSALKQHLDELRNAGITDWRVYFAEHPEDIRACAAMVKINDVNRATLTIFGADTKEAFANGLAPFLTEKSYETFHEELIALAEGKHYYEADTVCRTLQGAEIIVHLKLSILAGYEDSWSELLLSLEDITQRKQAEEALRLSEARYRAVVENQTEFIVRWKADSVRTFANEAYRRFFGLTPEQAASSGFIPLVADEDRSAVKEKISRLLSGTVTSETDIHRVIKPDGSIGWQEWVDQAIFDEETQQIVEFQSVGRDITERIRSEEALRKSEEKFRLLTEESVWGVYIIQDGKLAYVNPSLAETFGYEPAEIIGRLSLQDLIHPDDVQIVSSNLQQRLAGIPTAGVSVIRGIKKDGSFIYIQVYGIGLDYQGKPAVIGTLQDITERQRAEEQIENLNRNLEYRARQLATLNRAGQMMTSTLDLDAVLRLVMDEITRLLNTEAASVLLQEGEELVFAACAGPGSEKLIGTRMPVTSGIVGRVIREEKAALVSDARSDPYFYDRIDVMMDFTTRSLAIVPLIFKGVPKGVIEVINKAEGAFDEHDLALLEGIASSAAIAIENARLFATVDRELLERERAEAEVRKLNQDLKTALQQEQKTRAQLIQAGKLSALGRMVASVAHEFNNPLQTIKNCLFLIQHDTDPGVQGVKFLETATSEVQRLSNLVSQLRAVYRLGAADQMQAVELSQILEQVHSLVMPHLDENRVWWQYLSPSSPLVVNGIPDQLKQVFLNLSLNASDAMQTEGGPLTVNASITADGRQVSVAFRDTGPGIDPRDLPNLFEPFFTTKESGMGLGLAICYDIVQKHGGRIEVESQRGQGATFTVWLPLTSP